MHRRDDLNGLGLVGVVVALWLIVSPPASAVSIDDWLSEVHDGALHTTDMGECALENGQVIEACRLTFRTYGRLAPDLGNIVLMPTWLNGNAEGLATYNYLGPEGIVDTDDYFVIAVMRWAMVSPRRPLTARKVPSPRSLFEIRSDCSISC